LSRLDIMHLHRYGSDLLRTSIPFED